MAFRHKSKVHDYEEPLSLEREYEKTLMHIREVIRDRFQTVDAKLSALREWQDRRDAAVAALYERRQQHIDKSKSKNAA